MGIVPEALEVADPEPAELVPDEDDPEDPEDDDGPDDPELDDPEEPDVEPEPLLPEGEVWAGAGVRAALTFETVVPVVWVESPRAALRFPASGPASGRRPTRSTGYVTVSPLMVGTAVEGMPEAVRFTSAAETSYVPAVWFV